MYNTDFISHNVNGVIFMSSALLDSAGARHAFTTRHGGISTGAQASLNLDHKKDSVENVRQNHLRLAQALGYTAAGAVSTHQIHGDIIREAGAADAGLHLDGPTPYECDALVTNQPCRPLIAYSADCIPILLFARNGNGCAAIHAGWRGTQADIAAKTVRRLFELYQIEPQNILAAIGPGIGACCFSTHADVPQAMREAYGAEVERFIQPDNHAAEPGKFLLDLKGINAWRLEQAGLKPENIAVSPECTCCLPDKYWSHRFTQGERGGQAAVIML